jgi:hypothetical protein
VGLVIDLGPDLSAPPANGRYWWRGDQRHHGKPTLTRSASEGYGKSLAARRQRPCSRLGSVRRAGAFTGSARAAIPGGVQRGVSPFLRSIGFANVKAREHGDERRKLSRDRRRALRLDRHNSTFSDVQRPIGPEPKKSGRPDLNRRPLAPQASALIQAALRPEPSHEQTPLKERSLSCSSISIVEFQGVLSTQPQTGEPTRAFCGQAVFSDAPRR